MGKINLLSSRIYNRIAAGEVVERPFSVVKELVENSLDSGADHITVEIENGGITSIKVTDNGSGIEKSEIKKTILPHATSKISKLADLDDIKSLGFRGEALASIASVSKLTITSKPKEQEVGASIYVEGGEIIGGVNECGCSNGTCIEVNNLFYNTPVRERFLRSARSEENEISSTMIRFILGNSLTSFKYVVDGKVVYNSFGDGLESALVNIYGIDSIVNSFLVNIERNGIKIYGYIGKHHYTKKNRSQQIVFLNGRYVQNQTISSAISNAYSAYLMTRQYPVYVLSIEMPTSVVDVNVHPNKLDVRFVNNQVVYGTIYSIISKVLDGTSEALNIISNDGTAKSSDSDNYDYGIAPKSSEIDERPKQKSEFDKRYSNMFYTEKQLHQPFSKLKSLRKKQEDMKIVFKDPQASSETPLYNEVKETLEKEKNIAVDIFAENKAYLESLERKKQNEVQILKNENLELKIDRKLSVVGQVLNTYILLEDGQDIFFVDQHAAHERLLFDKLNQSLKENDIITQPLLFPFILNVNNVEFEFLYEKTELLNNMGIEISEFGKNAFKISAVPAFLSEMNLQAFFNEILAEIDTLRTFTLNDILIEKIAQKACKSAIKSGDKLSDLELKSLIEMLNNNLGLKCPHGRPIAVKITRTEIDKWFKRIV